MIWYRHWLELRTLIFALCAGAVISAWWYHGAVAEGFLQLEVGDTPRVLRWFSALVPVMGREWVLVWGAHVIASHVLAMLLPWVLAGTGLGYTAFSSVAPWSTPADSRAVFYTLALPLSRYRLIGTRFASAAAASFLIFAVYLAAHVGVLIASGRAVPFWPMAAASLAAALLVSASAAVISVLVLLLAHGWAVWLIPVPAALVLWFMMGAGRALVANATPGVYVGLIVLAIVTAGLATVLSALWVKTREV